MADRIGVINKGKLLLVEPKDALMKKLGKRNLTIELGAPLERIPESLAKYSLELDKEKQRVTMTLDGDARAPIATLVTELGAAGAEVVDVRMTESSLEDIFVGLVHGKEAA